VLSEFGTLLWCQFGLVLNEFGTIILLGYSSAYCSAAEFVEELEALGEGG